MYINAGAPTPVVTRDEWPHISQHLHCRLHMDTPSLAGPRDLYIMQYSCMGNSVKSGRYRNVEQRRRSLELGHNFLVMVVAVFPSFGHLESPVHRHLKPFRSATGASREWFDVPGAHGIKTIQRIIGKQTKSPSFLAEEVPPD